MGRHLNVRLDEETVALVEGQRLRMAQPGVKPTISNAVRALLFAGAEALSAKEPLRQ